MSFSLFPADQPTQTYRLKRIVLALSFYLMCAAIIGFAVWHGLFPLRALAIYVLACTSVCAIFFAVIRLGWNLRFRDQSLTEVQIACSALLCSYTLIYAGPFRGIFMFAYIIGITFGGTYLPTKKLIRLMVLALVLFPLTAFVASHITGVPIDWRFEFFYWCGLCMMLGYTTILVGKVRRMGARLRASNEELATALTRLTEMATHDELTGLYNRRYILDMLGHEKNRADRGVQATFCVCLLDIDHFKRINDTYGHNEGDVVLRTFARVAQQQVRTVDFVARWGGEEFLMLLPQTSLDSAEPCIRRIQAALEKTEFEGLPPDLRITISVGIVSYAASRTVKELVERADQTMYAAKTSGRNRIAKADTPA